MVRRALAMIVICVLVSSCSFAFVKAPPSDHPTAADDCTDSRVAPVLDTAFTGLMAVVIGLIIIPHCANTSGLNQDGTPATGCTTGQWVGLGWSAVVGTSTGISAYTGFRDTGRCRDRRALEAPIAAVH